MKKFLKLAGTIAVITALASVSIFTTSALADAYDTEYGDIADIARASQWATEGGYAGANYYDDSSSSSGSSSSSSSKSSSYTPDEYDGDCWWSGKTAHWDSQRSSGEKYQVELKRNGSSVKTIKTTSTSHSFSSEMNTAGTYKFRVRLVNGSKHGSWGSYSETYVVKSSSSSSSSGSSGYSNPSSSAGPGGSSYGWQSEGTRWRYRNTSGAYSANCWEYINNKWYFFDSTGYMATGWVFWNNAWYFMGPDGAMYVNCWTPDGYYVDGNGVWRQ